ncbi:MAG: manganese efflux pump [Paludibacteraceae bacterium]|nr:manganese efflux pump [Paludibacteraceae bacterium]
MHILDILLIAIGLAMDCFAVSVAAGIVLKTFQLKPIFRIALLFGLFQAVMPVIGWLVGIGFKSYIELYDHWVALFILSVLGIKMIREAVVLQQEDGSCNKSINPFLWSSVLVLAVATSIDALATGIVFVSFSTQILIQASLIIGLVSFVFSLAGNYIGVYFGKRFTFRIEIVGGIILLLIGLKIFIEHMYQS